MFLGGVLATEIDLYKVARAIRKSLLVVYAYNDLHIHIDGYMLPDEFANYLILRLHCLLRPACKPDSVRSLSKQRNHARSHHHHDQYSRQDAHAMPLPDAAYVRR